MRRPQAVAGVDRTWQGETLVIAAGPVPGASRASLVEAVWRLAGSPAARLDRALTASGRSWRPVSDAELAGAVHEVPEAADPAALLAAVAGIERGPVPFAFALSGDVLVLAVDHVLGDGYHLTRLLAAAGELATGGAPPEWLARRPARHPVRRAVWQQFGHAPERRQALFAYARAGRRHATAPAGTAAPPARTVPWRPSPAVHVRCSGPEPLRELKAWRRLHASGLSTVPLTLAAAELARRAVGVPAAGPPLVLFDARRYLRPDGGDVTGNFCAGLRLEIADPGDPLTVDAAIKHAVELGRPLVVTAAGAARSRLQRTHAATGTAPAEAAWDVAYTHMGKPPELARLTRTGARRPSYVGLLPPSGPAGVTVAVSELGDQLNVSVSFHDNVVDPATVADVVDRLVTDPAGLLEAHRVDNRRGVTL